MGTQKITGATAKVGQLQVGSSGVMTGADFGALVGSGTAGRRQYKVATIPLVGGVDTAGGLGNWVNPEAGPILIEDLTVDVTTIATGACPIDVGTTAVSAVTTSDNLIDGADVHVLTQYDNVSNKGTNGKSIQKLAAGKWITFSMADAGASAGFAGRAYVSYLVA